MCNPLRFAVKPLVHINRKVLTVSNRNIPCVKQTLLVSPSLSIKRLPFDLFKPIARHTTSWNERAKKTNQTTTPKPNEWNGTEKGKTQLTKKTNNYFPTKRNDRMTKRKRNGHETNWKSCGKSIGMRRTNSNTLKIYSFARASHACTYTQRWFIRINGFTLYFPKDNWKLNENNGSDGCGSLQIQHKTTNVTPPNQTAFIVVVVAVAATAVVAAATARHRHISTLSL